MPEQNYVGACKERLTKFISNMANTGVPETRKRLGQWKLYEYSKPDGTRRVRFMVDEKDEAQAEVIRSQDGILHSTLHGAPDLRPVTCDRRHLVREMMQEAEGGLLDIAVRDLGLKLVCQVLTANETADRARSMTKEKAQKVVEQAADVAVHSTGPRNSHWQLMMRDANRIISRSVLDPQVVALMDRVHGNTAITCNLYNNTRRNSAKLRTMLETCPGTLRMHVNHVSMTVPVNWSIRKLQHNVRQKSKLQDHEWELLAIALDQYPSAAGTHEMENLRRLGRMLGRINPTPENEAFLESVTTAAHLWWIRGADDETETAWLEYLDQTAAETNGEPANSHDLFSKLTKQKNRIRASAAIRRREQKEESQA